MEAGRIVLWFFAFFGIAFPIWVIMKIVSSVFGNSKTYSKAERTASSDKFVNTSASTEMDFDDWGNESDDSGTKL